MRFFPAIVLTISLAAQPRPPAGSPPVFSYRVVNVYPHDPDAFTQGLLFEGGFLYESTGENGKSSLRKVDIKTGKVLKKTDLNSEYFGEGLVLWKSKLIQLTWQTRLGFVYDRETFKMVNTFVYRNEGWGITHDGKRLIMSDGSDTLYFWDPETFKETGRLPVLDRGQPVSNLNELEFVRGEIWANIWQTDRIARISPLTGKVTAWIDLAGLLKADNVSRRIDVLNGIAYDPQLDRLFVTGKLWPKLFEIRLVTR